MKSCAAGFHPYLESRLRTRFAITYMGFIGLVVGIFLDETFGGSGFAITPVLTIIFVVITMGAFIIHSIESKK